jgi:hypothetical protein
VRSIHAEAGDARRSEGYVSVSLASTCAVAVHRVGGVLVEIGPGLPGVQPYDTRGRVVLPPTGCPTNPSVQDQLSGHCRAIGRREVLRNLEK